MLKNTVMDVYRKVPELYTDRLVLKQLRCADAAALYQIASDKRVSEYLLWDPHPSLKYTKSYLKNLEKLYKSYEYFEWGVFERDSGKLLGTCGFTAFDYIRNSGEIGYSFSPLFWGHGFATEAVAATVRFGFEVLGLTRVEACYVLENTASGQVLYKNGMRYQGEGERMLIKGRERRVGLYAMTYQEYLAHIPHPDASDSQTAVTLPL